MTADSAGTDPPARGLEPFVDLLLGALGEGVYGLDTDARATFVNPAAARMLGYEAEELLGRRPHDLIHRRTMSGEAYPPDECPVHEVLRTGETRHVSGEGFTHRDGTCFPVEYTATPVRQGGAVVGAVVVFRNITARVRAQEAVRLAHERQQALLENLPDAAWLKDAELRFLAVNEAFVQGSGHAREEFIGRRVSEVLSDEDALRYEAQDRRVLELGEAVRIEEQLPWVLGGTVQPRWIETIKRPLPGPDGRPSGLVAIARDVTDRKRREEEDRFLAEAGQVIIASLAWTETLHGITMLVVPHMGDWCVVSLFDDEGGVQNSAVRAADAATETTLREILARDRAAYGPANELVGRVLLEGRGQILTELDEPEREALVGGPSGRDRLQALDPASVLVVPLTAESCATGVLLLGRRPGRPAFEPRDLALLTEVGMRAALAIAHALEHQMATDAVRARDEVLRIVAHDLRGLVSTTTLSARSLASPTLDERSRRAVERIDEATHRMDRLIQDLMDVSRVDAGQLSLVRASCDPTSLLGEAASAAEVLARDRRITVTHDVAEELPPVWADRDRLLQVLANLTGNAIAYTPEGGDVRLSAAALGGEVMFCVQDTGLGIAADDLPHIFDPFWRARPGMAAAGRFGAGLGLTIARGIVGGHGGRIWASSEPGVGSRFCFTVPCTKEATAASEGTASEAAVGAADGAAATDGAAPAAPPALAERRGEQQRVRVLVVDDHEAIRAGVRAILAETEWIDVVADVGHGEEAVRRVRNLDPDLVVMDLSLPDLDGYEAMRRIGTLNRRTRVVVLTAHAPERSLMRAMEAGAYGFVRKSTAHRDLLPAIETVLRGEVFLDPHSNHVLVDNLERTRRAQRQLSQLTENEREIIRLTAEGYTAQEIADRVYLSPHTVATYRSQAMRKLGLEHRSDLVRFALETELISAG